jgi:hypothetical protein
VIWSLLPKKGISSNKFTISFDDDRDDIRKDLGVEFSIEPNESFPNEDDFKNENSFIRVRYDEADKVQDIEFLGGSITYADVPMHGGTDFESIENSLSNLGHEFRYTKWLGDGNDCVDLSINIATREDAGGDGNEIEWVILSKNFE